MKRIMMVILAVILTVSLFAHTQNPDKPLKGKWDFQMKKIWEVEKAGDYDLAIIQDFGVAEDGRIYILDQKTYKINIFSKEGKFISAFGKQGEGPGEIMRFYGGDQLFVMNDTIIIGDLSRIHYFALDGTYKKSAAFPPKLTPRIFLSEDLFISAPAVLTGGAKGEMIFYNINTKSEEMITEYSIYEKATDSQGGELRRSLVVENITPMLLVKSRNERIYYGMSDSYEIKILDIKGKKISSFSIEGREGKKVSQNYLDYLYKKYEGDNHPEAIKRLIKALPEKFSFFWEISIDKNGWVYIFISDSNTPNHQAIDIFSPEGKFLYSSDIKIEEGLTIEKLRLQDEILLMAVEDEEGIVKAVKYLLTLPPAL